MCFEVEGARAGKVKEERAQKRERDNALSRGPSAEAQARRGVMLNWCGFLSLGLGERANGHVWAAGVRPEKKAKVER